jgi:hypothetical protein
MDKKGKYTALSRGVCPENIRELQGGREGEGEGEGGGEGTYSKSET